VAVCCAASLALSLALWLAMERERGADQATLVIAPGTADAIAKGLPVEAPSEVDLRRGGKLTIVNQDIVVHQVAWESVPPGETVVLEVPEGEGALTFDCTTHPGGSLGIASAHPMPFWQAVAGALAAGAFLGVVLAGVTTITGRLGVD